MKRVFLIHTFLSLLLSAMAQYSTQVIHPSIHTLRVRYVDSELSLQRPFLVLDNGVVNGENPANALEISFDELSHDVRMYSYTIQHLDYDWTPSVLNSYEYIRGYTNSDIDDYAFSINTQQIYTNYRFTFPHEDMQLLASGNYVVIIYADGDVENVVAQVCFSVVDPKVSISTTIRGNTDKEYNGKYQQLDIDVHTSNLDVRNPQDVTVVVRQNNRLDNVVTLQQPTFYEPTRLRYQHLSSLIFEGGNEFRHFDTYSTYYAGYHVDKVRYDQGEYHAFLEIDDLRGTKARGAGGEGLPYITENDANGQWLVNCENSNEVDLESDYMWVHFCLPISEPIMDGCVFIGGDVFYNHFMAFNRMEYDAEHKCYYLYAYLKQGGYDYLYYVVRANNVSLLELEGSHWQTRNEYMVSVYYRPFGGRYDQLVGCVIL